MLWHASIPDFAAELISKVMLNHPLLGVRKNGAMWTRAHAPVWPGYHNGLVVLFQHMSTYLGMFGRF